MVKVITWSCAHKKNLGVNCSLDRIAARFAGADNPVKLELVNVFPCLHTSSTRPPPDLDASLLFFFSPQSVISVASFFS